MRKTLVDFPGSKTEKGKKEGFNLKKKNEKRDGQGDNTNGGRIGKIGSLPGRTVGAEMVLLEKKVMRGKEKEGRFLGGGDAQLVLIWLLSCEFSKQGPLEGSICP